ncbi:hypothetical protein HDU99_007321, partial [Rhizoclosmatium hyalinum]
MIGQMWKDETQSVKDYYQTMASDRMKEHRQKYPEYKYRPNSGKPKDKEDGMKGSYQSLVLPSSTATSALASASKISLKRDLGERDDDGMDEDEEEYFDGDDVDVMGILANAAHTTESPSDLASAPAPTTHPSTAYSSITGRLHIQSSPTSAAPAITSPSPSLPQPPSKPAGLQALLEYQEKLGFLSEKLRELVRENEGCLKRFVVMPQSGIVGSGSISGGGGCGQGGDGEGMDVDGVVAVVGGGNRDGGGEAHLSPTLSTAFLMNQRQAKRQAPNAFMVYRSEMLPELSRQRSFTSNELSAEVARLWNEESDVVRAKCFQKSRMLQHQLEMQQSGSGAADGRSYKAPVPK